MLWATSDFIPQLNYKDIIIHVLKNIPKFMKYTKKTLVSAYEW